MDPWPSSISGVTPEPDLASNLNFEDDFEPTEVKTVPDPLPDSTEYLARLESKLTKLRHGNNSSKSLVKSLSAVREACITQLLADNESITKEVDEVVSMNRTRELIVRHVAPHKQAITLEELVKLLSADQLAQATDDNNDNTINEQYPNN